jgi:beta-phosphoglucomutase-like phosphatase (HAD superfamily)
LSWIFVLVREDYELTKPHPEPYLAGLKRLGATKEETLVLEDSSRGLNSTVAAGIDCAIVYNHFAKSHDFSQAMYRIKTLIELKGIVLNVT